MSPRAPFDRGAAPGLRTLGAALALVCLVRASAEAQSPLSEHTLRLDERAAASDARVEDLAWIAGHWVGEGLGGISEEVWAPPRGGQMMGMFRQVTGDQTEFFELMTILEVEGRVVLRIKHFDADLHAWEEPEETVDFPLVRLEPGRAYFNGLTFRRGAPDELFIYLVLSEEGGVPEEETFQLKRAAPEGP